MLSAITLDRQFKGLDFKEVPLPPGDYVDCVFLNCNFQQTSLAGLAFDSCRFEGCDLTLARVTDASFRDVRFLNSKLLGVHFEYCNPFALSFHFTGCVLNLSSFFRMKLKGTTFKNCRMTEVDLAEADFSESVFDQCDLSGSTFDHTNLEKADFRTAYNYQIHPETNRIKKAKFSLSGLPGLLTRYGIEIE